MDFFQKHKCCIIPSLGSTQFTFTLLFKGQNYEPVSLNLDHKIYFIMFSALSFTTSCDISLLKLGPE